MGAVEEYLSAFQTGLSQPGDVLNVPVTLLDDAWVASHRICADTTLVGTIVGMSPPAEVPPGYPPYPPNTHTPSLGYGPLTLLSAAL